MLKYLILLTWALVLATPLRVQPVEDATTIVYKADAQMRDMTS